MRRASLISGAGIDQLVFSGGGTRCFWFGGFLEVVQAPLGLAPKRIAGVSGGALSAACYIAGRERKLLSVMGAAFDGLDQNVRLDKFDEQEGVTPHQRIYREVVSETLDAEAVETISAGPIFEVLLAHPPSTRFPKLSTAPMMLAYRLELAIRSNPHLGWPELLGVRQVLADGRQAARDGRLVDLICNAAVIPPVFNVQRWDGEHVIDGGMASKAPIPHETSRRTLILLTRIYRNAPAQAEGRIYVMPSRETPADKIDFTSREKIERTWELGARDARRFLDGPGARLAHP